MKKLSRSSYLWIGAGIIALLIIISLFGDQGFIAMYKAHNETQFLLNETSECKHTIDSLNSEINHLKNDTTYIESIAREKLGMARRNEKIFKFIEDK